MDILNFISWIKSLKITSTLPNNTLIPVGIQDPKRGDSFLPAVITSQDLLANVPTGAQGPIGPQGVPGPVGPAGLTWQGTWSAAGTYVVNDAVGFGGASWYCINNIGPSPVDPATDIANWALLASQGATGPQGPQGIQGPVGPSGTATPSFSKVPAGLISIGGTPLVVTFSTIPANTYNNNSWPIFCVKTALQKVASTTTMRVKVYISNTAPTQGIAYSTVGAILIADAETTTSGINQRVVKIEKDIWFTNNLVQFLNNGSNPNTGFSDSGIGGNSGITYNSGIFDNAISFGNINWSLNTYIVVVVESIGGTTTIGSRYLSVTKI